MKSSLKLFYFLALTFFLTACQPVSVTPNIYSPTPAPPEQSTHTPTVTPTRVPPTPTLSPTPSPIPTSTIIPTPAHPLTIGYLQQQTYQSDITIEIQIEPGENYDQFIVSYVSEGLKIYSLLTIPVGETPLSGWPVIVFNHGYIPHYEYTPTDYYEKYVQAFATNGYIVLMPDYRGHGKSEGKALGVYSVPDYTIDVLNAVHAIKQFGVADRDRIGMWGHSMGGYITLRTMIVDSDIRAGVIWGGVVASYADLCDYWFKCDDYLSGKNFADSSGVMATMGPPTESPDFWAAASANTYLDKLQAPLQLHHAEYDKTVPAKLSRILYEELIAMDMEAELYIYPITDHNISTTPYFGEAMERTLDFFAAHLK